MDSGDSEQQDRNNLSATNPAMEPSRLAVAVTEIARRTDDDATRAQLHSLAGILVNLKLALPSTAERNQLEAGVLDAIESGDEQRMLETARRLAAHDRAAVKPLNWSEGSGA